MGFPNISSDSVLHRNSSAPPKNWHAAVVYCSVGANLLSTYYSIRGRKRLDRETDRPVVQHVQLLKCQIYTYEKKKKPNPLHYNFFSAPVVSVIGFVPKIEQKRGGSKVEASARHGQAFRKKKLRHGQAKPHLRIPAGVSFSPPRPAKQAQRLRISSILLQVIHRLDTQICKDKNNLMKGHDLLIQLHGLGSNNWTIIIKKTGPQYSCN